MKKMFAAAAVAVIMIGMTGCADLGFGVDVDPSGVNPYWYGSGYIGNTYWNTPVWNSGPIYNPRPPRPPMLNPGPGPVRPPQQAPQAPQQPPIVNINPGVNGVPTTVGGIQRPGNGGLPNPSNVQQSGASSSAGRR